jgi:hypothetical protein
MLRLTRLCACLAVGLAVLCASCTGDNPPDDPTGSLSTPSTSASPSEPSAGRSPSSKEQALLGKVRAEGRLSVIVELKLPQTPPGDTDRENTEREKKAIAEAQDQLLAQLEPLDVEVQTRFERFPLLTLTVDEAVMRHLQESPLVVRVHENESHRLQS